MDGGTTNVVVLVDNADESEVPLEVAGKVGAAAPGDVEQVVCSFYPPASETFGVPVVSLDGDSRLDPRPYRRFRALLRDADVLHVHSNAVGAVARIMAAAMGVSTVKTEHNTHSHYSPIKNLVNGSANLLSDVVVSVSEAVAESFGGWERSLLSAADVENVVISNGVDVEAIRHAATEDVPVTLPDGFLIGGGGKMVPQKNLSTLIEATATAVKECPDLHLVLTGDGPQRDTLESLAADRGIADRVLFTGFLPQRTDVHALFHHLDGFAFPSRYEGWGVAAGEAMAAGLPVIAGDVPALREVVGEAGLFVDPEDPAALADRLAELAANPDLAQELGTAGQRRITEQYPIERTVEAHLALYRRLAGGRD